MTWQVRGRHVLPGKRRVAIVFVILAVATSRGNRHPLAPEIHTWNDPLARTVMRCRVQPLLPRDRSHIRLCFAPRGDSLRHGKYGLAARATSVHVCHGEARENAR